MKQVVAIVKPYLVEKVLEGLKRAPLEAVITLETDERVPDALLKQFLENKAITVARVVEFSH